MITHNGLVRLGFKPEIDFVLRDNSDGNGVYMYEWHSSSPQPTEAEIETAHNEWKAEYDAQEYARNRQSEYPSLNDLIVALWENVVEERASAVISLEADRQAVKTKYPKP
jgi:hypothetical protein